MAFPFLRRSTVRAQMSLCLQESLIGRHDHTAIINRSRCRVEETSFQETVSNGEAQLILDIVTDIERKLFFCVLSIARYVSREYCERLP